MYRIGLFSKISKTTVKTLRYYDEMGLLSPEYVDPETGYRYYSTDQLLLLHKIISFKQAGLSINDINKILDGTAVQEVMEERKKKIEEEIKKAEECLSRINYSIIERDEDIFMKYQAVVKELPEGVIFSKRLIIPNHKELFKVVPVIGEAVKLANPDITTAEPEYCFNIYHDGEYKEENIDVEICEAVNKKGTETEGIVFKDLPGVTAVSVLHKGSYDSLREAYAYLYRWIEDNDYQISGHPRESFIDGIWNKDNEEDWLTEVQIPVKK